MQHKNMCNVGYQRRKTVQLLWLRLQIPFIQEGFIPTPTRSPLLGAVGEGPQIRRPL